MQAAVERPAAAKPQAARHGTSLLVLQGSNLGTAEDLARQLAEAGEMRGFSTQLASLDDYAERLPASGAVAIVCASYNGVAPDNAAEFHRWLDKADDSLNGVRFSVFGCGNTDWASTYQAVPRRIDERLAALGATRVHARGEGDAREDMDGAFQDWSDALWPTLVAAFDLKAGADTPAQSEPLYTLEELPPPQKNALVDALGAVGMRVIENRELQSAGSDAGEGRSTRHVELQLPEGVSYRAGDHLSVVPRNGPAQVERAMARFGFDRNAHVRLHAAPGRKAALPVDEVIAVDRLLGDYVELQDVATRKQIALLAAHTECPFTKPKLAALVGRRRGVGRALQERGAAEAQVGARPAGGVSGLPGAVRGLPRDAVAAHAALLLDLVLADGRRRALQRHGGRGRRAGALGARPVRGRVLQLPRARRGRRHGARRGARDHGRGLPPARRSAAARDHGGAGHRPRALSRLPAGARGADRRRARRRARPCCSSAAGIPSRTSSTPTNSRAGPSAA